MAQTPRKGSSVIVVRSKKTIALPPCTLGFASLVEPDTYDPDKPAFKMNAHYNPAGLQALPALIQAQCIDANLERLRKDAEENKINLTKDPQDPKEWLEAKLKQPKEGSKIQLPYLVILTKAMRKDREGHPYQIELGCWPAHGNQRLDLKKLKLGMGSIVAPIVYANLFYSKLIGFPQPSLQLAGLRVLKRETWGAGGPPVETDDEDIKAVMGEEFAYDDDLSAFAEGSPSAPGEVPDVEELADGPF